MSLLRRLFGRRTGPQAPQRTRIEVPTQVALGRTIIVASPRTQARLKANDYTIVREAARPHVFATPEFVFVGEYDELVPAFTGTRAGLRPGRPQLVVTDGTIRYYDASRHGQTFRGPEVVQGLRDDFGHFAAPIVEV